MGRLPAPLLLDGAAKLAEQALRPPREPVAGATDDWGRELMDGVQRACAASEGSSVLGDGAAGTGGVKASELAQLPRWAASPMPPAHA
jgi:hypothetical protein